MVVDNYKLLERLALYSLPMPISRLIGKDHL